MLVAGIVFSVFDCSLSCIGWERDWDSCSLGDNCTHCRGFSDNKGCGEYEKGAGCGKLPGM